MVETLEVDHGRSDTRKYPKSPPVGAAAYRREALADAQSTKQEEALDSPETAPLFFMLAAYGTGEAAPCRGRQGRTRALTRP